MAGSWLGREKRRSLVYTTSAVIVEIGLATAEYDGFATGRDRAIGLS
jgi:hypothetical protein